MSSHIQNLLSEMDSLKNPEKAKTLQRFFKTGKGEYGEGDIFLGITVPQQRGLAKKYIHLNFDELQELLNSKIHEHRLTALLILTYKYQKAKSNGELKRNIYKFYLKNTKNINNWDLVDTSCYKIVGNYLVDKNRDVLYELAKSENLWERRISIVSTFEFIRKYDFNDTLKISKILLNDRHDLIHKAVGWMLREVGKRNMVVEEEFLERHCAVMPRTMLRYAVEKFDKEKRLYYLKKGSDNYERCTRN